MLDKAEEEEYEAAGQLRDSIRAVEKALSKQNIVQDELVDQDVFGLWRQADLAEVAVLFIRGGKLVGRRSFRQRDQEFPDAEVLGHFVQQYYDTGTFIPDEILVASPVEDASLLGEWLSGRRGKKVRVLAPQRGQRARLIALANKNAAASAVSRKGASGDEVEATLERLAARLSLRRAPRRIECFDIAHIQGTSTVASMVTFVDGRPEKSLYRKFNVKSAENNDFASMYEVILRRLRRGLDPADERWKWPDLLVVDGGKGQLGSALAAVRDLGIELSSEAGFDVIALAKERELGSGAAPDRVYLRARKDPIALRPNTRELYLLGQLRDEAHRFANTFHRRQRTRRTLRSALDDVPGIGTVRRRALLRHFGSVKKVALASVEELAAVEGMTVPSARALRAHFEESEGGGGAPRERGIAGAAEAAGAELAEVGVTGPAENA